MQRISQVASHKSRSAICACSSQMCLFSVMYNTLKRPSNTKILHKSPKNTRFYKPKPNYDFQILKGNCSQALFNQSHRRIYSSTVSYTNYTNLHDLETYIPTESKHVQKKSTITDSTNSQ